MANLCAARSWTPTTLSTSTTHGADIKPVTALLGGSCLPTPPRPGPGPRSLRNPSSGFELPTAGEIREMRNHPRTPAPTPPPQQLGPPRRSTRMKLWKEGAMASVLLSTVLLTFDSFAIRGQPEARRIRPAILEVGGTSATCEVIERCGNHIKVAEPIFLEDLLESVVPGPEGGAVESITKRTLPGELWVHVRAEWTCDDVIQDVLEAVNVQLQEGRAVVFERHENDAELWDNFTEGWDEEDYTITADTTSDGNMFLRIARDREDEFYVDLPSYVETAAPEEALVTEDNQIPETGEGGRGITFFSGVPGAIASSPSTSEPWSPQRGGFGAAPTAGRGGKANSPCCPRTSVRNLPALPEAFHTEARHVMPPLRFNQMVGVDLIYVHDVDNTRHELLSIVDYSSSYHVVVAVPRKNTLEKAYTDNWVNVYGAPEHLFVDLETGLQKAPARASDWTGSRLRAAPGQAHWQVGFTEKQGGAWKAIFQRVCEDYSVGSSEVGLAIAAVNGAKNALRKVSGYSPLQHVFGVTPNLPEDLFDGPHADDPADQVVVDDQHARQVAIRAGARAAFHHVQVDDRVRRALAGRPRVQRRTSEIGEQVFFYRKERNNKRGMWRGPGTVIGYDQAKLWVTKAGRCLLCAPEHVRPATSEELGDMFTSRMMPSSSTRSRVTTTSTMPTSTCPTTRPSTSKGKRKDPDADVSRRPGGRS